MNGISRFQIRPAELTDLAAIEQIEQLCFSLPWTYSQLEAQMKNDHCIFLLAENDKSGILGYVGCQTVLDEGYISNIAVAPACRRQRVGDSLLSALIQKARAEKLSFLTLEVRQSNEPAIALYEKHGFRPVGKRRDYYDKPKEAAVLMTLFL